MEELNMTIENITNCKKDAKTSVEIAEKFNADDVCMKCENIVYNDGIVSCKYSQV